MSQTPTHAVYIEVTKKRTFAGAIDWPGWCRSGRDEAAAIQSLLDCAPRYARIIATTPYSYRPPSDLSGLSVVEHLTGDSTTEFGAPSIAPASDASELNDAEGTRLQALLRASWDAFDAISADARGRKLSKGPRGGGRELDEIARHVTEAQVAFLGRIGVKLSPGEADNPAYIRQVGFDSLAAAVHHHLPEKGPRGGTLWKPRYFIRRAIWHIVDHAWEIEDRVV
jgi:hypothetical protein